MTETSEYLNSLLPVTTVSYQEMQAEIDRINLLKKIIPTLTVLVFIALVLWPALNSKEGSFTLAVDRLTVRDENAKLIKPRYVGMDKYNHPVNISAEMAFRKSNDDKDYYLKNLLADMKMSDGTGIEIRATNGILDTEAQKIILDGAVTLSTESNFNLATDQAMFLINEKIATGENGVSGTIPFGIFSADEFHVNVDQEIIKLKSRVKFYFNPDRTVKPPEVNSDGKQEKLRE
ncbi:MAG: LPS export ABC transporter periplasmic protein LptC [Alphaproteobacteria bacterium]|nr:MAG: LPS export ABC transporter periplasmic protein LptC [Alphaproteobacteria bacterium]